MATASLLSSISKLKSTRSQTPLSNSSSRKNLSNAEPSKAITHTRVSSLLAVHQAKPSLDGPRLTNNTPIRSRNYTNKFQSPKDPYPSIHNFDNVNRAQTPQKAGVPSLDMSLCFDMGLPKKSILVNGSRRETLTLPDSQPLLLNTQSRSPVKPMVAWRPSETLQTLGDTSAENRKNKKVTFKSEQDVILITNRRATIGSHREETPATSSKGYQEIESPYNFINENRKLTKNITTKSTPNLEVTGRLFSPTKEARATMINNLISPGKSNGNENKRFSSTEKPEEYAKSSEYMDLRNLISKSLKAQNKFPFSEE